MESKHTWKECKKCAKTDRERQLEAALIKAREALEPIEGAVLDDFAKVSAVISGKLASRLSAVHQALTSINSVLGE